MTLVIIITVAVVVLIVASVLLFPEIKIGKIKFSPYWVIALLGALLILVTGCIAPSKLVDEFIADSAVNPLKILAVFFGMTILSVFLDEAGFFAYLASLALHKAGSCQKKLFAALYFTVAVLTVFTSNDIIILTFTPFIIYFCSHAKIDPKPYLFAEFAAANTFSMLLIIGNPTNIYLAAGMDFMHYCLVMALPAILSGVTCFLLMRLLFKKSLSEPICAGDEVTPIKDKPLAFTALSLLCVCTILLAVSGYIDLQMWYIALGGAACIILFSLVYGLITGHIIYFAEGIKRLPWQLAPFLLSMFTMVLALSEAGVTDAISSLMNFGNFNIIGYLVISTLSANLLNNIPMSVLLSTVAHTQASVLATVIGSNIGALLTPIGALAGIMWAKLLRRGGVNISFKDFVKNGAITVSCVLPVAAASLYFSLWIFGVSLA